MAPRWKTLSHPAARILLWLLIAILGSTGALEFTATRGPLGAVQKVAVAYLTASEKKAFEAFAVARTIDAAVSVLKSTDLSIVVAQVAPLEVLQPVDDLSKEFSDVMVMSIVAVLLQEVVLLAAQTWALTLILPIGCVLMALAIPFARRPAVATRLAAIGRTIVILALFARFTIPFAGYIGNAITQKFLAADLDTNLTLINQSSGNLNQISTKAIAAQTPAPSPANPPAQTAPNPSIFGKWMSELQTLGTAAQTAISKSQALIPSQSAILAYMTSLPRQIVKVIAIFLIQTVLTPFLVAFFLHSILKNLVRPRQ